MRRLPARQHVRPKDNIDLFVESYVSDNDFTVGQRGEPEEADDL